MHCAAVILVCVCSLQAASGQDPEAVPSDEIDKAIESTLRLGFIELQEGNYADAEDSFRTVLQYRPDRVEAIRGLAAALNRQGRQVDAINVLQDGARRAPDNAPIRVELAQLSIARGRCCASLSWLESAQSLDPDFPDIDYWFGRAHLVCRHPMLALNAFCRHQPSNENMRYLRQLGLGTAYGNLGLQSQAVGQFNRVIRHADENLAQQAREIRRQLDNAYFGRAYTHGSLRVSYRYDDNPAVIPEANVFGLPLNSSPSSGNLYLVQLSHDVLREYNHSITAGATFLQVDNHRGSIDPFDTADIGAFVADARSGIWHGRIYQRVLRADYDYLWLGTNPFLQRFNFTPSWTVQQNNWESITLLFRYSHLDFVRQGAGNNTPFDQDSDNFMTGLSKQWRWECPDVSFSFGYQYNNNVSDGANFDYQGHRILAGIGWEITERLTARVNGGIHFRDYQNPNSIVGIVRNDEEYTASAALQYEVRDDVFLTIQYNRDRNDSILQNNDYSRDVWDVAIEYRLPQ